MNNPLLSRLRYHVTGAIERGEGTAIEGISFDSNRDFYLVERAKRAAGSLDFDDTAALLVRLYGVHLELAREACRRAKIH